MTALAAPRADSQTATGGADPARQRGRGASVMLQLSIALSLLLLLLLGFVAYVFGLSGLAEHRAQDNLRKTFAHSLGQAVAPVGPAAAGTPVAVIDIPKIGLNDAVIIEGTSARQLTDGPGHRPDTVLPGQAGVSVIYGHRVAFGAPFAHLMRLDVGDRITVTTGQGRAIYRVSSFGDGHHPAPANSINRLVLSTSEDAWVPHDTVSVSADLVSRVQAGSGRVGVADADQKGLATGVGSSLLPALLWSQALLLLAVLGVLAAQRWSPVATYLCAAPIALAVLWNLYENLTALLPNVY